MRLRVSVYKNTELSDCTNGGVSSKEKSLMISDDPEDFEADLILVKRVIFGKEYRHCQPPHIQGIGMCGGNFVYSSDSRFRENFNDYPLSIHDREE